MNQIINSTNLEQALQSRASTGGCGGQQGARGYGRGRSRRGHNNFNNKNGDGDTNSSKRRGNTSKPKDNSHIQCFRYKKYGQYKLECRTKLHNEHDEQVNTVEIEQNLVLAYNVVISNIDRQNVIIICVVRKNCFHNQINQFEMMLILETNPKF